MAHNIYFYILLFLTISSFHLRLKFFFTFVEAGSLPNVDFKEEIEICDKFNDDNTCSLKKTKSEGQRVTIKCKLDIKDANSVDKIINKRTAFKLQIIQKDRNIDQKELRRFKIKFDCYESPVFGYNITASPHKFQPQNKFPNRKYVNKERECELLTEVPNSNLNFQEQLRVHFKIVSSTATGSIGTSETIFIYFNLVNIKIHNDGKYDCIDWKTYYNRYKTSTQNQYTVTPSTRPPPVELIVNTAPKVYNLYAHTDFINGEVALVMCEIYEGNPPGSYKIMIGQQAVHHKDIIHVSSNMKGEVKTVTIATMFTTNHTHNGIKVGCVVYDHNDKEGDQNMYKTMRVVFAPTEMHVMVGATRDKKVVVPGDKLECKAKANPKATIQWIRMPDSEGEVIIGRKGEGDDNKESQLIIPQYPSIGWNHYKCIATNKMGNDEYKSTEYYYRFYVVIRMNGIFEAKEWNSPEIQCLIWMIMLLFITAFIWRRALA